MEKVRRKDTLQRDAVKRVAGTPYGTLWKNIIIILKHRCAHPGAEFEIALGRIDAVDFLFPFSAFPL
jgi:hypothetical protein